MTITIPDIMREIRNGFPVAVMEGPWRIDGGVLSPITGLEDCRWIALEGSLQDGVHPLGEGGAIPCAWDESWTGRVWLLNPPPDFLHLCDEIIAWAEKKADPGVRSESFGAYSRTLASSAWQDVFASALRPYRQMFSEVKL